MKMKPGQIINYPQNVLFIFLHSRLDKTLLFILQQWKEKSGINCKSDHTATSSIKVNTVHEKIWELVFSWWQLCFLGSWYNNFHVYKPPEQWMVTYSLVQNIWYSIPAVKFKKIKHFPPLLLAELDLKCIFVWRFRRCGLLSPSQIHRGRKCLFPRWNTFPIQVKILTYRHACKTKPSVFVQELNLLSQVHCCPLVVATWSQILHCMKYISTSYFCVKPTEPTILI